MNTTDAVDPRPVRGNRIKFVKSLNGISQTRWEMTWKLSTLILRRSCLSWLLSLSLTLACYGDSKYHFVPEPGAKGQEYVYQMDPLPKGMHTANFKLWIPNSVGRGGKIRGVIAVSGRTRYLYFRHAEIFRSGHWQALASELHLALFMHNTAEYCCHDHVACSAGVGECTKDTLTAALDHFARTTGHSEMIHSGFIFTGRSASGRQALFIANQMPERTIAMVLYSPASSLPNPLTTTGVPVLINMAGLDLKHANPISLDKKLVRPARAQGAPWAGVFQAEELHGGSGDPSFVMDWVRTTAVQLRADLILA